MLSLSLGWDCTSTSMLQVGINSPTRLNFFASEISLLATSRGTKWWWWWWSSPSHWPIQSGWWVWLGMPAPRGPGGLIGFRLYVTRVIGNPCIVKSQVGIDIVAVIFSTFEVIKWTFYSKYHTECQCIEVWNILIISAAFHLFQSWLSDNVSYWESSTPRKNTLHPLI